MPTYAPERCEACGEETEHRVAVVILEETSGKSRSRHPYRTTTCTRCGAEHSRRLHTA